MLNDKPALPFPCSARLYNFMAKIKHKINYDDTHVIGCFWGEQGGGKSVKALWFDYVISGEKLNIDKIAFSKEAFIKAVLISEKEAVQPDEGISIFFSRGAMTKEGRLMAELMQQIRQKNLFVPICIPQVLSVDSLILESCRFIAYVWESRKKINGRMVTIKGNMDLYPKFKHDDYMGRMLHYLKIRKGNPMVKIKRPRPWLREAGQPFGEGFKGAFYPVDEKAYKAKKDSVLDKYRHALERKPRNPAPDYDKIDKLIKAGLNNMDIGDICKVSAVCVKKRRHVIKKLKKNR